MHQYDEFRAFKKAWATNADTSAFASRIPTTTEPSNDGVVSLRASDAGVVVPARVLLLPYGLGADNDAFSMRVIGWRRIGSGVSPANVLWIPIILGEFACTISAAVGVVGSPVLNTERFADTITVVKQPKTTDTDSVGAASRGDNFIYSAAGDLIAFIDMLVLGCDKLEFTFDQTTNAPTTNVLYAFY